MIRRSVFTLPFAILCLASLAAATEPTHPAAPVKPVEDSLDRIGPLAQASPSTNSTPEAPSKLDRNQPDPVAALDEAPLLEFVEKHQPELLKLLKFMKKRQPQQYEQALKELSRAKQRLISLEKRDAESYAIELELWQVRSELRMLVAEILASPKDTQAKLRNQLHLLVEKEHDLDTARLQLEQKRFELRLSNVNTQLDERTENRDTMLAKAIKTWENRAFKSPARSKKP